MLRTYYQLTKPGIVYSNVLSAIGGFFFAARGSFDLTLFVASVVGMALVIASGCVFNNYIDRDIDKKMARTKKRALADGTISVRAALTYATVLGLLGTALLAFFTNLTAVIVGLIGFFFYVVVYAVAKRRSVHGTLVGSISGSVPIAVGYCAVTGKFDLGALLIFLLVAAWQMPHFYAIAMYRLKDYTSVNIPVLPAVKGMHFTKVTILAYIVIFLLVSWMLRLTGYTSYTSLVVFTLLSLYWLWLGFRRFSTETDPLWGRTMFRFSLVLIVALSGILAIDSFLP